MEKEVNEMKKEVVWTCVDIDEEAYHFPEEAADLSDCSHK